MIQNDAHWVLDRMALRTWDEAWTGVRDAPNWGEFKERMMWFRAMRPVAALIRDGGLYDYLIRQYEAEWRKAKRKHKLGDLPSGADPRAVELADMLVASWREVVSA